MQELGLEMRHSGPDDIGGTIINNSIIKFSEGGADFHLRSLIHLAHLDIDDPEDGSMLRSLDEMKLVSVMWSAEDYHTYDPICNTNLSPVANCRITARNIGT
jgi:hypothetical protein